MSRRMARPAYGCLKRSETPVERVLWNLYPKCPKCGAWPSEPCYLTMLGGYVRNRIGLPYPMAMPHQAREETSSPV